MINSLFIINHSGDIILEKHWKSVIHRSICDYFFDAQKRASAPEDVPPVISTPHHYLISIFRNQLYFVAVVTTEVSPLLVIEFLHRVVDTFKEYFDECSDTSIKDNYVVVFEVLPVRRNAGQWFSVGHGVEYFARIDQATQLFPTVSKHSDWKVQVWKIAANRDACGGGPKFYVTVSETLPTGQLSNIPWRRAGVKYTNNEAYFDCIEEIDAIIDRSGSTVFAEIQGYVDCCIKLTGMPDLTLSFMNPRILDDTSFHPCVRFKRWDNERVLSFIPPDGNFRLMSYHIGSQSMVAIPIYVRHSIVFKEGQGGKLDITVGPKQSMGKILEDVSVEIAMPKTVLNCSLTPSQGKYSFDPGTKIMTWDVGKIEVGKPPTIRGTIAVASGTGVPDSNPSINVKFQISQLAVSGLKVSRLDLYGEKYKPFKGVKYLTKAGRFQVRTS